MTEASRRRPRAAAPRPRGRRLPPRALFSDLIGERPKAILDPRVFGLLRRVRSENAMLSHEPKVANCDFEPVKSMIWVDHGAPFRYRVATHGRRHHLRRGGCITEFDRRRMRRSVAVLVTAGRGVLTRVFSPRSRTTGWFLNRVGGWSAPLVQRRSGSDGRPRTGGAGLHRRRRGQMTRPRRPVGAAGVSCRLVPPKGPSRLALHDGTGGCATDRAEIRLLLRIEEGKGNCQLQSHDGLRAT